MQNPVLGVPVVGVPPRNYNNVGSAGTSKDLQGMPGTSGGLALRLLQLAFCIVAFSVMASVHDFQSVTAFCFLVAATVLQSLWSLSMGVLDGYDLLFKRSFRRRSALTLFAFGDWLTALFTLAAACSSAGITVLLGKDLDQCGPNDCGRFETAVAVTFLSWFLGSLSFFFSFWLLASRS